MAGFAIDYGLELNSYFLREKSIDLQMVAAKVDHAAVLYGDDDPYVTQEALRRLADGLNVQPVIIENGGHLNAERGFTEFSLVLRTVRTIVNN